MRGCARWRSPSRFSARRGGASPVGVSVAEGPSSVTGRSGASAARRRRGVGRPARRGARGRLAPACAADRGLGHRRPRSRAAGMTTIVDIAEIATMGLTEVAEKGRALWRAIGCCVARSSSGRLTCLVLIDFPEFNLALGAVAKRRGVPVFYYVSPQVWAWRRGRVRKILRRVDRLAVLFPFEPAVYGDSEKVVFVGHPLLDRVRATRGREQTLAALRSRPRRSGSSCFCPAAAGARSSACCRRWRELGEAGGAPRPAVRDRARADAGAGAGGAAGGRSARGASLARA